MSDFVKYLILGIVQGITEPLPISSSGHMIIFEKILGVTSSLDFKIITNFGSLIAILIFYRKFLAELIKDAWAYVFKKDQEKKQSFIYIILVTIATIPAGIAGVFLEEVIDDKLSNIFVVAICLVITGTLLLVIDYASKLTKRENITFLDSILIGLAQVFGLFPGISRSGSTTSVGVLRGVNVEDALRFSFMMYIPVSVGSLILSLVKMNLDSVNIPSYLGALVLSFLGTLIAIRFLFKIVKKENLKYFGYYCLSVSTLIFLYLLIF